MKNICHTLRSAIINNRNMNIDMIAFDTRIIIGGIDEALDSILENLKSYIYEKHSIWGKKVFKKTEQDLMMNLPLSVCEKMYVFSMEILTNCGNICTYTRNKPK